MSMKKKLQKLSSLFCCLLFALVFALAIPNTTEAAGTGKVTNPKQTYGEYYSDINGYLIEVAYTPASNAVAYTAMLSKDNVTYNFIEEGANTTFSDKSHVLIGQYTKLAAGSTYYVKIVPCYYENGELTPNMDGASAPLQVVTAPAEVASSGFYQTAGKTNSITAKWNSVSGATGYNVYVKKYQVGDWQLAGTTTSKSYTIKKLGSSKLVADTCYSVAICPIRKSSAGYTAESSATGKPFFTVPKKVSTIIADWKLNSKQVTVAWPNGQWVDGYELQFYNSKGKSIKKATISAGSKAALTYTMNKATKNSNISVRIRSYTKTGNGKKMYSDWSAKKYFISQAYARTSSYNSATKQVTVKWPKVTGAKKYVVYIGTTSKNMKKVATLGSNSTTYTFNKVNGSIINTNSHYYLKVIPQGKLGGKTVKGDYGNYLEIYWTTRYY